MLTTASSERIVVGLEADKLKAYAVNLTAPSV